MIGFSGQTCVGRIRIGRHSLPLFAIEPPGQKIRRCVIEQTVIGVGLSAVGSVQQRILTAIVPAAIKLDKITRLQTLICLAFYVDRLLSAPVKKLNG